MKQQIRIARRVWPVLIVLAGLAGPVAAQSQTAFSYQGLLTKNALAVEEPGGCAFRFGAHDMPSGGSQQGPWSTHNSVAVTAGVFTVPDVDFGAGVLDGGPLWLEIEVQCPADAGWQLLSPRQPITGSPYAVHGHSPWNSIGPDLSFSGGDVGIGTPTPSAELDVFGTSHTTALVVNPGGTTETHITGGNITTVGTGSMHLNMDNTHNTRINNLMHIKIDGKVGIGTALPSDTFHVAGDVLIEGSESVDGTFGTGGLVVANATGTAGLHLDENNIETINSGSLHINGLNTNNTRINGLVHVKTDGKVGIGAEFDSTSVPESLLHVGGEVTTDTLTIKAGSDLAERFDVTGAGRIEPGHVLAIDQENPGKLVLATRAYDRSVAGAISGAGSLDPGLVMGQDGSIADGAHAVALSGRVYVWVDAAHGAVRPGDLLTTSSTPGHAMKVADSERAQGAVLGKAMTHLEEGRGLVLTLVSLQ